MNYYNFVLDSDGDDALNLKYVNAIGYIMQASSIWFL